MANALYTKAKEAFLTGSIDWNTDTIKAVLVSTGYTPVPATDQFLTAIPGGSIIATSPAFTGASDTGGVADANNLTFAAVGGVTVGTYLVIYKDTGSSATSPLIAIIDTATGLPVTPNGGDITIAWDTGANKIFAL